MAREQADEALTRGSRQKKRKGGPTRILLWTLALVLMGGSVVYQRLTGPTHPRRGEVVVEGVPYKYRLVRSGTSTRDARVELPDPGERVRGTLFLRRYKTGDEFSKVAMGIETGEKGRRLVGLLPKQPAAGKLEYYVILKSPAQEVRIPESPDNNVVIRFKDEVPPAFLIPHIFLMFFGVLIGIRTGLGALFGFGDLRRLTWATLGCMTLGGMVFGPIVQKYAFGELWTGFPYGRDLTDNKMLIMWLAWVGATLIFAFVKERPLLKRLAVLCASVAMLVVYLIPHSMRGSELDYSKVDQGVSASDAIGTGD